MTIAEENYPQMEKNAILSLAKKKFYQYIYGKLGIHVQTDHKPLESILKKPAEAVKTNVNAAAI